MSKSDNWSYHKAKSFDRNGRRWHFATHYFFAAAGDDEAREFYFRDDDNTEFGVLRFERLQDNPYRDWAAIANKIMNTSPFRKALLNDATRSIWKKNWK
ncbi:MAG: hypothetical protein ABIU09_09690 [Pyrinomonadaceae bacterium]